MKAHREQKCCSQLPYTDHSEFANVRRRTLHSELCVCGYDGERDVWEAAVGKELLCECLSVSITDLGRMGVGIRL